MITIFTTCRAFNDPHINLIQRNAIKSWQELRPRPQIIVMGQEPGTKEACEDLGVAHVDYVRVSPAGVPFLDSMVQIAEKMSCFDHLLFVSGDMLIFQDTIDALQQMKTRTFLGGVTRWNKYIDAPIDNCNKKEMLRGATQESMSGGDYFLFSRSFFKQEEIPPFVLGRSVVDWWLYKYALDRDALWDLTACVTVIHQNHELAKLDLEDHQHNFKLGSQFGGRHLVQTRHTLEPNGPREREVVQARLKNQNGDHFWLVLHNSRSHLLPDPTNVNHGNRMYHCEYLEDEQGRRWVMTRDGMREKV